MNLFFIFSWKKHSPNSKQPDCNFFQTNTFDFQLGATFNFTIYFTSRFPSGNFSKQCSKSKALLFSPSNILKILDSWKISQLLASTAQRKEAFRSFEVHAGWQNRVCEQLQQPRASSAAVKESSKPALSTSATTHEYFCHLKEVLALLGSADCPHLGAANLMARPGFFAGGPEQMFCCPTHLSPFSACMGGLSDPSKHPLAQKGCSWSRCSPCAWGPPCAMQGCSPAG